MTALLYLLFFCSGLSGLIYQVVWVREFGNVFGNTIYSASLVIAVFMLGLGLGSYLVGVWADRRYAVQPDSLLRAYGYVELIIALMGLAISALLPHLGQLSALASSYTRDPGGWYVLSTPSYLVRGAIAVLLLTPITLLMGGTLTLLIRHLVRRDLKIGGWRIALLYSVNTAGAALGCFLTDFALVPLAGLRAAQMIAVLFNLIAAAGALRLAARASAPPFPIAAEPLAAPGSAPPSASPALALTGLALGLSGFAAMGMEILWFRHFTLLLGGLRAVFSLLLTVILVGIGLGSLAGGLLHRRTARPALWLMGAQGLFVASTLLGLASADLRRILLAGRAVLPKVSAEPSLARTLLEVWLNAKPILLEVAVPALLMGFAFPLANAVIQRAEASVGRRAGVLYLSNTVGAVCGALAAGFLLLPGLGIQRTATVLTTAAGLAVLPLYAAGRRDSAEAPGTARAAATALAGSTLLAGLAVGLWLMLPSDYVISRAQVLSTQDERLLTVSEGITEVVAVTELLGGERRLLTNGHPMSSTGWMGQRYMRALAHIPLLSIDQPETVLVIGFGVGNTAHAATLHPSVRRIEVADLSREVLSHATFFRNTNGDVLKDQRLAIYLNDGRQHLRMQPEASYDLITLEPPPLALAGVGALYSREFYALARTRLTPKGYLSQWLPAYQVPRRTTLAMIRAFLDVFPQAVLLSGAHSELLLIGANGPRVEIDPARLAAALSNAPAARADLERLALGSVREIVGTFLASAETLADATRYAAAVTDDRPIQEYGVRSRLPVAGGGVPAAVVDLSQVAAWCPQCFAGGRPVPLADGLDTYLALLDRAYKKMALPQDGAGSLADPRTRRLVDGSAYLAAMLDQAPAPQR
jgi:spermidine synthase